VCGGALTETVLPVAGYGVTVVQECNLGGDTLFLTRDDATLTFPGLEVCGVFVLTNPCLDCFLAEYVGNLAPITKDLYDSMGEVFYCNIFNTTCPN